MLNDLENSLKEELALLEYPPAPWVHSRDGLYDVIIIGAGMAGLSAAFALKKEGIHNILLLDGSTKGKEGPWDTYARMLTLRSGKNLAGPALGISSLTFQAWYVAQFGKTAWEELYKIPTLEWMDYLRWYRKVLDLPVHNGVRVLRIVSERDRIALVLETRDQLFARKVVLATGREGFGGFDVPEFVQGLSKKFYAHTSDAIDFQALSGKRLGVIGMGASGFDAAHIALQAGVKDVEMLVRRKKVQHINKGAHTVYPGYWEGYYQLSDQQRWEFMHAAYAEGSAPAPHESLNLVEGFKNFSVHYGVEIEKADEDESCLILQTNHGKKIFDFLILATGFAIDGAKQPELAEIYPDIRLWGSLELEKKKPYPKEFDRYPYLGPHFQFQGAPYLQDIYCFNYAASFSHGQLSGDIPGISVGADRLAKGIAADFFKQDFPEHLKDLQDYSKEEFTEKSYRFFSR